MPIAKSLANVLHVYTKHVLRAGSVRSSAHDAYQHGAHNLHHGGRRPAHAPYLRVSTQTCVQALQTRPLLCSKHGRSSSHHSGSRYIDASYCKAAVSRGCGCIASLAAAAAASAVCRCYIHNSTCDGGINCSNCDSCSNGGRAAATVLQQCCCGGCRGCSCGGGCDRCACRKYSPQLMHT